MFQIIFLNNFLFFSYWNEKYLFFHADGKIDEWNEKKEKRKKKDGKGKEEIKDF